MIGTWRTLPGGGSALVARPEGDSSDRRNPGGVLVIGELDGMTDLVHEAMSTLTEAGHAVAAVDLFTGTERGLQLPYDDAGRARGFALLRDLQAESLVGQIRQTRDLLEPGPVGIVGFSVGGFMALVATTHLTFEVVVAVYPGWTVHGGGPIATPAPLQRAADLGATRVLVLAGSDDALVGPDLDDIDALLGAAGVQHELLVLPGVGHGFACAGRRATYSDAATSATWRAILDALAA